MTIKIIDYVTIWT